MRLICLILMFMASIIFAEKNGIPYSSVISGATVLKSCSNESMEKVKDEVRDFLSDKKNIENIIKIELNNYLNLFFTVFWIILLMNSINFTDNMDGFASLNTSFIAFALGIISFFFEQNYLADISFILGFSIIGFLILNFPPAKIYMGDSGSLFIGFVLGFISILFNWNPLNESLIYNSFTPVLLFFTIPLLDFLTVFTYRIKNHISPTTGGTDHISHRLLNKGYSVKRILIIFTGINLLVFLLLSLSIFLNEYSFIVFFIYITFISYLFFKFSKMQILE